MKVQSRYIEYSGGKRVYESPWKDHRGADLPTPEGCLKVEGKGMTWKEAMAWKRKFEAEERKAGCSNFEYRVAV